jgi:hypothetical protein
VYVLSLGASLLSAAALAAARNVNELCKISLETISITFRLELELRQRSVQIDATPGNWARTVSGFSGEEMQKLLDKFHKTKVFQPSDSLCKLLLTCSGNSCSPENLYCRGGAGLGYHFWVSLESHRLTLRFMGTEVCTRIERVCTQRTTRTAPVSS